MRSHLRNYVISIVFSALAIVPLSGQSSNSSSSTRAGQSASGRSDSGNQQIIEGCIVRTETAYYIQPRSGQQTRLNAGDQDLTSHMGQHVRLTGTMAQGNTQTSTSQNNTQTSSSSGPNSNAGNEGEFEVTRVDVIAASCPAYLQRQIDQQNNQNPK